MRCSGDAEEGFLQSERTNREGLEVVRRAERV